MKMSASRGQDQKTRVSNDGSQSSTFNEESEEDIKTVQCREEIPPLEEHYPAVLESAPFPMLGSLEEITQTLSRVKSNQTDYNEKQMLDRLESNKSMAELPTAGVFKQVPYHTDGIRNPGWLTVLSCFLVNFFVFGTCFSWGNYQRL
jgi:hypothetical protein